MTKIVTANTLATGHVVFLASDGRWVRAIREAARYEDDAAADAGLQRARRDQERSIVVDPFVVEAGSETGGRPAMTLRDTIRAFGPTIRYRPQEAGQG